MIEVKVRLAEKSDIPTIVRIGQEWITFNSDALLQRYRTLEETFDDVGHMIFIAEKDGEIIGWFDVRTYKDWFMLRKSIHIEHANVMTKYRSQEVGSQILHCIFDYFQDKEEDMYCIFWYTESSWDGFFGRHNKMVNSDQNLFIRLIRKKTRDLRDEKD